MLKKRMRYLMLEIEYRITTYYNWRFKWWSEIYQKHAKKFIEESRNNE